MRMRWAYCAALLVFSLFAATGNDVAPDGEKPVLTAVMGNSYPIEKMAFSADGKYLVTVDEQRMGTVWETESGRVHSRFFIPTHRDMSPSVITISRDNSTIGIRLYRRNDYSLILINLHSGELINEFVSRDGDLEKDLLSDVQISPQGKYLLLRQSDGVALIDSHTKKIRSLIRRPNYSLYNYALSNDGNVMVAYTFNYKDEVFAHEVNLFNQDFRLRIFRRKEELPLPARICMAGSCSPNVSMLIT